MHASGRAATTHAQQQAAPTRLTRCQLVPIRSRQTFVKVFAGERRSANRTNWASQPVSASSTAVSKGAGQEEDKAQQLTVSEQVCGIYIYGGGGRPSAIMVSVVHVQGTGAYMGAANHVLGTPPHSF